MVFLGGLTWIAEHYFPTGTISPVAAETSNSNPDCTPPDWAVAMGHADMWKLHHNCK